MQVISEHREPENGRAYFQSNTTETRAQCTEDIIAAFKLLAQGFPKITMHLQVGVSGREAICSPPPGGGPGDCEPPTPGPTAVPAALRHLPNVRVAAHLGTMAAHGTPPSALSSVPVRAPGRPRSMQ